MPARPILLNSCARAATAGEARFRVDTAIAPARATRVVGLDDTANVVVRRVAELPWHSTQFFTATDTATGQGEDGQAPEPILRALDGVAAGLADELVGADATVLVASTDEGAATAQLIGSTCARHGIMTAGLALADASQVSAAMAALRPYARVLIVPAGEDDLVDILQAIRA